MDVLTGGTMITVASQALLAASGQTKSDSPSVIISGAGPAGIAMAYELKHMLAFDEFTIYEKATEVGGTWATSEPRSSASNIPTNLHDFWFNLNPRWSREFCERAEVLQYIDGTVDKFGLRHHMHTAVEVVSAHWQKEGSYWSVRLKDLVSGIEYTRTATVFISAAGGLRQPPPAELDDGSRPRTEASETRSLQRVMLRYVPLYHRLHRLRLLLDREGGETSRMPSTIGSSTTNPAEESDAWLKAPTLIVGAREDVSLEQYWRETRGAQAYWGSLVSGFPNFGILSGPNTIPANSSALFTSEMSVQYLSRVLVAPILDNRAAVVTVRQATEDLFNMSLQSKLKHGTSEETRRIRMNQFSRDVASLPGSPGSYWLQTWLKGGHGVVYTGGTGAWWINMLARWLRSIKTKTWLALLLLVFSLRVRFVKARLSREVGKYKPYEEQVEGYLAPLAPLKDGIWQILAKN